MLFAAEEIAEDAEFAALATLSEARFAAESSRLLALAASGDEDGADDDDKPVEGVDDEYAFELDEAGAALLSASVDDGVVAAVRSRSAEEGEFVSLDAVEVRVDLL